MPRMGCCLKFLFRSRTDAGFSHNSGNTIFPDLNAFISKIAMDPGHPVYPVAGSMQNADFGFKSPVLTASFAFRTLQLAMVAGAGDVEQFAHTAYFECLPMSRDESKFHF